MGLHWRKLPNLERLGVMPTHSAAPWSPQARGSQDRQVEDQGAEHELWVGYKR